MTRDLNPQKAEGTILGAMMRDGFSPEDATFLMRALKAQAVETARIDQRRERIAVAVLPTCAMRSLHGSRAAELAVQYADALIAELDK